MDNRIEVIKYYEPAGEEYVRDLYVDGVWVGIEIRKFVTLYEAQKLVYSK